MMKVNQNFTEKKFSASMRTVEFNHTKVPGVKKEVKHVEEVSENGLSDMFRIKESALKNKGVQHARNPSADQQVSFVEPPISV